MAIRLVRHAKAGSRRNWIDDDRTRPLTSDGVRQAEALADRLGKVATGPLLSSPYLRCVQTLEPLAAGVGREPTIDIRLTEGAPFEPVLQLIAVIDDGAVLCSHGDLIPDVISALERRGAVVSGAAEWRKASVWVLERDAHGTVTRMTSEAPPA